MTKRILLPALAALALAGCGPSTDVAPPINETAGQPANAEANVVADAGAGENKLAAVLALNDRQRDATFIRALIDAGIACQKVTSSVRLPDQDGKPLWRANCSDNRSHMISVTPDGTVNIVSRTDR